MYLWSQFYLIYYKQISYTIGLYTLRRCLGKIYLLLQWMLEHDRNQKKGTSSMSIDWIKSIIYFCADMQKTTS